ncbi:hypothetical protein HY480_03105, partial [Candidatus Uhrbacteria bacterium]|nr:hypothetical protein [Candidatus Uhrbacteria bacterium]
MADAAPRLPDAVVDHIEGAELDAWYRAFFATERFTDDERDAIEEAVSDVYHQRSTLDAFVARVRAAIGDAPRGAALAIEILGNDFLKIEEYLGMDIAAYIRSLGGDPAKYLREVVAGDVVAGVIARVGIASSDPVVAKRIASAGSSFIAGVRDRMETVEQLTRSVKIGGAGLDAGAADRLVDALATELATLRSSGAVIRSHDGQPPESSLFHLVKSTASGLIHPEDEAEIERIRAAVPGTANRDRITAAVDRVLAKVGAKFSDAAIEKRFRSAVESRVRDIRDAQETRELLIRPQNAGGLAIPPEKAEKVLAVISEEVRALHGQATPSAISNLKLQISKEMIGPPVVASKEKAGIASSPDGHRGPRNDSDERRPSQKDIAPTTAIVAQLVHPVPPEKSIVDSQQSTALNLTPKDEEPVAVVKREIAPFPPPPAILPPKPMVVTPQLPTATLVHPVPQLGIRNQESG